MAGADLRVGMKQVQYWKGYLGLLVGGNGVFGFDNSRSMIDLGWIIEKHSS